MKKKTKRGKSKMLFVTFIGLALIAVGIKASKVIQEKIDKRKNNNPEDLW